jgi:UDP-3-O-[3-hydroxymyristoyl] glucosamine N-acyltransferase
VGEDCVLGRGVYVGPGVRIGDRSKIQNYALVYEPARIGMASSSVRRSSSPMISIPAPSPSTGS